MESIIASPLCYPEEIAYNVYVSWLTAKSVQGTCPESPKMYINLGKLKQFRKQNEVQKKHKHETFMKNEGT